MSLSVKDATESAACSTSLVGPLSRQIVREMLLMEPGCLVPVVSHQIHADSHVHLYLQPQAAASLLHVLAERPGVTLIANSMLRTLPEQAMVRAWAEERRCGVTAAAPIGSSLHEQGLAIDVAAAATWRDAMARHGWKWLGPSFDPPHYQFDREGVRGDISALGISAFQHLYNRANPEHAISIDSVWGPETSGALMRSPAGGFPE